MKSRASALGHAIHPMLIVFPMGLLPVAVIFDVIFLATDRAGFATASAYLIAAGVAGGAVAALPGLVDWLGLPKATRARRVGALHRGSNAVIIVLFAASWVFRAAADDWEPGAVALVLSFAGVAIMPVAGWLGGELVGRLGVGVDDDAHLDAPSSLRRDAWRLLERVDPSLADRKRWRLVTSLKDAVVVVTGASAGIGRATRPRRGGGHRSDRTAAGDHTRGSASRIDHAHVGDRPRSGSGAVLEIDGAVNACPCR